MMFLDFVNSGEQMSVFKRGRTWCYEFVFAGQRIRESSMSRSKTVAVAAERTRRRELEESINRIPKRQQVPLVKIAAQQWLAGKTGLAEKSMVGYRLRLRPIVVAFGEKLVCDIGLADIAAYQSKRVGAGRSARTVNYEIGCLRGILKLFGLWGTLTDRVKSLRERHDVGKAMSFEDEEKLSAAAKVSRSLAFFPLFILSVDTGLRSSEVKALRRRALRLEWQGGVIQRGELIVEKSKTEAGTGRVVPLTNRLCAVLTTWLDRFPSVTDDDYVFPYHRIGFGGNNREPVMYDVRLNCPMGEWKYSWLGACRVAGVRYRWHDLRHTFISRLGENPNVSEETIRSMAGHVSRKMLERYCHIRAGAKREAIASLGRRNAVSLEASVEKAQRPN
jgi:integrase